jgi:hypothetical protein
MAVDIGADGEGWIHQNDGGLDGGIEMIVDVGGVVPGDGNTREQ